MNGLNKLKQRKWSKLFYVIIAVYLVLIMLLSLLIFNIPTIYDTLTNNKVEEIKQEVLNVLDAGGSEAAMAEAFAAITESKSAELVVISPAAPIYSSMPTTDFALLNESISPDVLNYQGAFLYSGQDGTEYQVWLAVYQLSPQFLFEVVLAIVIGGVILLCAIIIVMIVIMFRNLISPLTRLRDNIFKLKEYRLNEVAPIDADSEYDLLSEELSYFTDDLRGKFDSIGVQYTLLERELQERQEVYRDKLQLVRALIHDLKAPLSIEEMQIDQVRKLVEGDAEATAILNEMEHNNQYLMSEIVDSLQILKQERGSAIAQKQDVDIIEVVRTMIRKFKPLFKERKIKHYLDGPRNLNIFIDPIQLKQLIHNVIANACSYTEAGGKFELEIYQQDSEIVLQAYNDLQDTSQIDFERVFDLFYSAGAENPNATGIGMYTIKTMVAANNGVCTFSPVGDGVCLEIRLPLGEPEAGDQHA
ncbi:sensor histidine kinase [Culicoidibacter larvae]|uniref:histidine kinase n=1 Tax=Culicoidibacter larvae TaxID=2579976 RepID=A0A5R8QA37_9FIRM|nr:HAMP domain-containing sensor histidine kinase [Culicoidibacter larvae]TLG72760.1 HAMP domain-containing histidine kinase [Culicoidibacter larvae]